MVILNRGRMPLLLDFNRMLTIQKKLSAGHTYVNAYILFKR